jgi:hypothetical protein
MSFLRWLHFRKADALPGGARKKLRRAPGQNTQPNISPRHGRRILRREQLFSVVRESLIRGGVLSTSYEFKVLALDAWGDRFMVLLDLSLPVDAMPDEFLLEIERWIQTSARTRLSMQIPAVYWRRKAVGDPRSMALRAAVAAKTRQELAGARQGERGPVSQPGDLRPSHVVPEEIEAFRQALRSPAAAGIRQKAANAESAFIELSTTQFGQL